MTGPVPGRKSARALVVCGLLLYLENASPGYLFHLGVGQAKILAGRRPIQQVLEDPAVSGEIKERLALIGEAKEYAQTHIGLAGSDTYTDYYQVPGPAVAYVLVASPALELRAYSWCFPVVGCMPYKGFFSLDRARGEQQRLDRKGFDTHLRRVSAYSTLGWFKDPVFSTMLADNPAGLIETVIHEMVHGTVFVRHKVEFNEGIATFVGRQGAIEFLEHRFGPEAPACVWARDRTADERLFQQFFVGLRDRLSALYASPLPEEEKRLRKRALLEDARKEYRLLLPRFRTQGFAALLNKEWNNALVVSFLTYIKDLSLYERLYEKLGRNLREMVRFLRGLEKDADPERRIEEFVS